MRGQLFKPDLQHKTLGLTGTGFLGHGFMAARGLPCGLEQRESELLPPLHPQRSGVTHQAAHGTKGLGALCGGDGAAGIEDVEGVARLQDVGVGGHRQPSLDHAGGLRDIVLVEPSVDLNIGIIQVVAAHLVLLLAEGLTVGDDAAVGLARICDVLEMRDALLRHQDALHAVGQFNRDRPQILPTDLLEIGELRDLHAIQPYLPAKPPCSDRWLGPVVLDETHVVGVEVDPEGLQRPEVELLRVAGFGFQDHLKLGKRLNTHRVLAIAGVVGAHRRLHVGHIPRLRAKHPQHRRRVHGAGPHFRVVGLPGQAAARGPVVGQDPEGVLHRQHRARLPGQHLAQHVKWQRTDSQGTVMEVAQIEIRSRA